MARLFRLLKQILWSTFLSSGYLAAQSLILQLGAPPPEVVLDGDLGGLTAGGRWSSAMLKSKVFFVIYTSPGAKDDNNAAIEAVQQLKPHPDRFGSVAIINMAASSWPDFIIAKNLRAKQAQYPRTLYVEDRKRVLVQTWGLSDNASVLLLFGADGALRFRYDGPLPAAEIERLVAALREALASIPAPPTGSSISLAPQPVNEPTPAVQ